MVLVSYEMSEQEFVKTWVRMLMPRAQIAWLVRHRDMGPEQQFLMVLCRACLRAIGLATDVSATDFATCHDLAEALIAEAVAESILAEPEPESGPESSIRGKVLLKISGTLPRAFRDPVKADLVGRLSFRPVLPVMTWSVLPGSPDWNQMTEIAREAGLREPPPPPRRRGKRDPRPRRPHSSGLSALSAAEKPVTVLGVDIDPGLRPKATLDELPRRVELPDQLVAKPPALVGSPWVLEGPVGLTA